MKFLSEKGQGAKDKYSHPETRFACLLTMYNNDIALTETPRTKIHTRASWN